MSTKGVGLDPLITVDDSASSQGSVNDVAIRLKLIRETLGISQRELAKRAGVTNSGISMIELGQVSPSIQSLERILSVIPMGLSDFFSFQLASRVRISRAAREALQLSAGENDVSPKDAQLSPRFVVIPVGASNALAISVSDTCGLVLEGKAQLKSLAGTESLVVDDTFYIPARQLHQFTNSGEVPLKLFFCALFVHSR